MPPVFRRVVRIVGFSKVTALFFISPVGHRKFGFAFHTALYLLQVNTKNHLWGRNTAYVLSGTYQVFGSDMG